MALAEVTASGASAELWAGAHRLVRLRKTTWCTQLQWWSAGSTRTSALVIWKCPQRWRVVHGPWLPLRRSEKRPFELASKPAWRGRWGRCSS